MIGGHCVSPCNVRAQPYRHNRGSSGVGDPRRLRAAAFARVRLFARVRFFVSALVRRASAVIDRHSRRVCSRKSSSVAQVSGTRCSAGATTGTLAMPPMVAGTVNDACPTVNRSRLALLVVNWLCAVWYKVRLKPRQKVPRNPDSLEVTP